MGPIVERRGHQVTLEFRLTRERARVSRRRLYAKGTWYLPLSVPHGMLLYFDGLGQQTSPDTRVGME